MTGQGATAKTLPADLKRITHSGVLDIPKELLTPVVDAAANEVDRPEIMKHLRECLAEPNGKHWRRVFGALVLVEALVKNGSEQLMDETAEGRHFDLVQRLSFLEVYENSDKRVMNNIRKKAQALRKDVIPLLQNADGSSLNKKEDSNDNASTCSPGDNVSTCSPGTESTTTKSSTTSLYTTGFGSADVCADVPKIDSSEASKRTMILNNIVTVGHSEDTTSESEGGQDKTQAAVRYREPHRMTAKERDQRRNGSSSDSEAGSHDSAPESKPATQTPAHTVDLLGL